MFCFNPKLAYVTITQIYLLNAAVAGAGVAIGKTALAVDDLRAGRLICLFASVVPEEMAYYAVYRPGVLDQPRVRVFRDWLFSEFAEI